jgi:O-antigen/teichoic acid export membrane protein
VAAPAATGPIEASTRRNVRGSSLLTIGRLIAVGINLVTHVLVVRYFARTEYGALALALSVVSTGSSVSVFGMNRTLARFLPIYEEQKDLPRLVGALAIGIGLMVGLSLAIVLGFYAAEAYVGERLIRDDLARSVLTIMILLVPLQALDGALLGLFAIFDRPRHIFLRRHIYAPILGLGVAIVVVGGNLDLSFYAVALVVVSVVGLAVYGAILVRLLIHRGLFRGLRVSQVRYPFRELLGFSLPLVTTDVVYILRRSVIVLILGAMASVDEVALFSAVLPIANQNTLVLESFRLLFTPAAARLYARKDDPAINDLYWQTAVWVVIVTLPFLVVSVALAGPITTFLFGEKYADAAIVLAVLGTGFYINSAFGHNGLILRVFGQVRFLVTVDLATAVIGVAATIPLIAAFGATGAAIGVALILVVQNVLYQVGIARSTSVSGFDAHYIPVYVGVPLAAGAVGAVQVLLGPPLWIGLGLAAVAVVAYGVALRHYLRLGETFPELRRLPLARFVLD